MVVVTIPLATVKKYRRAERALERGVLCRHNTAESASDDGTARLRRGTGPRHTAAMGDAATVIEWNGTDLPAELRELPPGRYHLAAVRGAPSAEEIARAMESARDEDGVVDPFALAVALAVPTLGTASSEDRSFRFADDEQMARLMDDDA